MEQVKSQLSKRKKVILKISTIILVFLIICTFVSKSIYNMLLPEVEVVKPTSEKLKSSITEIGKIVSKDNNVFTASSNLKIKDVFVAYGDEIKKGDKVFSVDIKDANIQEKKLELAVLQLQNQLQPQDMTNSQKQETEIQLKIAQMEYNLFETNNQIEKKLADKKREASLLKLEEQSKATQAQLQVAIDELNQYRINNSVKDSSQEKKLRKNIDEIKTKLKQEGLTEENKKTLEAELKLLQQELEMVLASYPKYDPVMEERLKIAVLQASNLVLFTDASKDLEKKNSAQLEYEIALAEYNEFAKQNNIKNEITEEKLKLDILKYENTLNPTPLTDSKKKEINLSINIAKQELQDFRETFPKSGIVVSPYEGKIVDLSIEKGDDVPAGAEIFNIVKAEGTPLVEWQTSLNIANNFIENANILVTYTKKGGDQLSFSDKKKVTETVTITEKKLDKKNSKWIFKAPLEKIEDDSMFGESVTVEMVNLSEIHSTVVPLSCIGEDYSGNKIIRTVTTQKGLFSQETIVEDKKIEVVEKNNLYAAIQSSDFINGNIVKYTTKPLRHGSVVRIVNEIEK